VTVFFPYTMPDGQPAIEEPFATGGDYAIFEQRG
jgi:hypothetical protein